MSNDKNKEKNKNFLSALWGEPFLGFVANAIVLFLIVCLTRLISTVYPLIIGHFRIRIIHALNDYSFGSYRIPDLLNLILSIWITVSLAAIAIDYFIVYPIRYKRVKKRAANGTSK